MYKNFFVLKRVTHELNNIINGSFISQIYSQERGILVIELNKNDITKSLIINTNPQKDYLILKDNLKRAKKNTLTFFSSAIGAKMLSVKICKNDRIIKFETTVGCLYFFIKGPYTNAVYINQGNILSFKKMNPEKRGALINIFDSLNFEDVRFLPASASDVNYIQSDNDKQLGKVIKRELNYRLLEIPESQIYLEKVTKQIIFEIFTNPYSIFQQDENYYVTPSSFIQFETVNLNTYSYAIDAIDDYIRNQYIRKSSSNLKDLIKKFLDTALTKASNKLNNLRTVIDDGPKDELYNKYANLILINLYRISKGIKSISVEDIYDGSKKIEIPLDSKLNAQENANQYFEKAKNSRINYEKSEKLYTEIEKRYIFLQSKKIQFESTSDSQELKKLKLDLKIKNKVMNSTDLQTKFKHYVIDNKYHLYVGKSSENNDELTTKFAKQNDLWFHARAVPGSHVVLRVDNTKEPVSKVIIKKAAAIAAYHSKAKTAGVVPVSFTFKKYVVKKKGMTAGKVALLKEDVVLVKPEIPPGCEFISIDLE